MKVKEKWKDVVGYEGYCKVSNLGRVKSLARIVNIYRYGRFIPHRRRGKLLSQWVDNKGYVRVKISKDGSSLCALVHRLVAEAFIENPNNLPEVNHKWGNKLDNRASELEWTDRAGNMHQAGIKGLMKSGKNHYFSKSVINCRGYKFDSMAEAAKAYGLKSMTRIGEVCSGKHEYAGKYEDGNPIKWSIVISEVENG